ncbi:MAG: porin [Candidatus Eisenbacteria bacterium]|uniref:Porin n=1 Tax=Eiseniibacteriota bacterium TaxID=2212470 RepID=A0A956N9B5_UNCEI|nr:porin [Candidatus Eisenbacteria bacterium]
MVVDLLRTRRRTARFEVSVFSALLMHAGLVLPVVLLLTSTFLTSAHAARWDWSGSVSVDQKLLDLANPEEDTNSGEIVEWALKTTVEVSDKVTANVKLCTTCHGLTVDQAYAEVRFHPLLGMEAGRINVPFGDYYLRHDTANDKLGSKPLPYAMGHMVRFRADQFNLGVVPMPYSDQGVSFFGDAWFRDSIQLWYAAYAVNGFRAATPRDFNFKNQVADGSFVDNNHEPALGGRVGIAQEHVSLGASYMTGAYDADSDYDYDVWGVDLGATLGSIHFRSEYLERTTNVLAEDVRRDLTKRGFYMQAEVPVGRYLEFVGRFDGLLREGPILGTSNDESSGIGRWTAGLNVAPSIDYTFRMSYEYWRFTDFSDVRLVHLGVVVSY